MTPVGSAGDVHPFVGIGRLLHARGHDVTVITSAVFQELIEHSGLRFVELGNIEQMERVTRDRDLWHPLKGLPLILRTVGEGIERQYQHVADAVATGHPNRTVLVHHALSFGARCYEDKHGTPAATLHLAPSVFRSDYAQPVMVPGVEMSGWPRWVKRCMWWMVDRLAVDRHIQPALNGFRRRLGLAAVRRPFRHWLHSPRRVIGLFPRWYAAPQPDWPAPSECTGFPLFDEAGRHELDDAVEHFIVDGEPPIVLTPGSANRQATRFFAVGIEAAQRLHRRALLLTRFPEQLPSPLPDHALHIPYAPLSQLLPRCAAIVHHGGIGTCAQGLATGTPQLIMPMGFDQPDNAARLRRLGAGDWLTPNHFDAPRVTRSLQDLINSAAVAQSCADIRQRIAHDDANGRTCELIEALAEG